ncbi:MAG: acyltransferase family protein [Muribaculaceae bacterium]
MTKEQSLILKGVAILLMLYCHLFNQTTNVELCNNMIFCGEMPLALILSRATNPVSFFLILSGYGLYTVMRKRGGYNVVKKMRNLYIHYWITLLIFIPLGAWIIGSHRYPGSLSDIISNVTAWHTTWNGEIWFLFPYILLALTSSLIFKIIDRVKPLCYIGVTLFISLAMGFCISRYGATYLYHHQLPYMPVLYFSLLFAFSLGAMMAKYDIVDKCKIGGVLRSRSWCY